MLRLLIPALLILLVLAMFLFRRPALIRGIAEDLLVSPDRPAVAVEAGPGFALADARRADPALETESAQIRGTGALWYALWVDDAVPARLLGLLSVLEDPWRWPVDETSGFHELRAARVQRAGLDGTAATFILPAARDPWKAQEESAPWDRGSLTRRFTFRLWHNQAKLLVEYREPLPDSATALRDDPQTLAAFEDRADLAFRLLRGSRAEPLPKPSKNLPYPPQGIDRSDLARYLGGVKRNDGR